MNNLIKQLNLTYLIDKSDKVIKIGLCNYSAYRDIWYYSYFS